MVKKYEDHGFSTQENQCDFCGDVPAGEACGPAVVEHGHEFFKVAHVPGWQEYDFGSNTRDAGKSRKRVSAIPKTQRKVSKTNKIILIQGANLTYLGKREPEIYGRTTAEELDAILLDYAKSRGFELEIFYTNLEGEAINRIYRCADQGFDGLVMNPAGFSYAGYALKDCIKGAGLPYVEIHISNVAKRNIHCVLSEISIGLITGFGIYGYQLALDAMLHHLGEA